MAASNSLPSGQALVHFTLHAGHSADATAATLLVQDLGRQLS